MNRQQRRAAAKQRKPANRDMSSAVREIVADAHQLHLSGRLDDAERLCRQALAINAHDVEGLHILGVIAYQTGRASLAIDLFTRLNTINPKVSSSYCNLGVVLKDLERVDEAITCFRKSIEIKRDYPAAYNNLGIALQMRGRREEAIACYREALDLEGHFPEAHNNLGTALMENGSFDEAVACYQAALDLKPDYAEVYNNLGNALFDKRRFADAVVQYERALVLNPDFANAHNNLGNALRELGKLDDAVTHYERAQALCPNLADVCSNLGKALTNQGQLAKARQAFERAIALQPDNPRYYRSLLDVHRVVAGDPHVTAMEELAKNAAGLSINHQQELHFALGKAYEDLAQYDLAFRHLLLGNALRRREVNYDEATTLGLYARIRAVFTPELIRKKQEPGDPSAKPIFIVGMPRSGTTLVEQILASHPQVFGAGEREDFPQAARDLHDPSAPSLCFPEVVQGLSGEVLRSLGTNYLATVGAAAPDRLRITDKMPGNFANLGLIHLALPNARIVHIRRDPIDTCLSCFSLLFTDGHPQSYDLAELGRYYRAYATLMEHWRHTLPAGVMLEVGYEDVVADIEQEARRIVAHCGLEWDASCLAFHKTGRTVRTASAAQVRQEIYPTSIGRWRRYGDLLQPLIDELHLAG
jgi:tetratricopeptide (TPR) repeat protein